jgi:hypothetical protein
MAKRNTTPEKELTCLNISKNNFEIEIQKRIERGQEILNELSNIRSINEYEFSEFKDKYLEWHDFNRELLKQSFDYKNYNEYEDSYSKSGEFDILLRRSRSEIDRFRKKSTQNLII